MHIYCDGACEPVNPGGHATWGFVAVSEMSEIHTAYGYIGHGDGMTNNVAEYTAVIEALKWAYLREWKDFTIYSDSQLVVNQGMGRWQVKSPHLGPYVNRVRNGLRVCQAVMEWIPREQNERADEMSRKAYEERIRSQQKRSPA